MVRVSVFFVFIYVSTLQASENFKQAEWKNNNFGKEQIVLPGYSPLIEKDLVVYLGADREYRWHNSFLPAAISIQGQTYIENNNLTIVLDGKTYILVPDSIQVLEKNEHHVVIEAEAKINNNVQLSVVSRIEYDGLIQANINFNFSAPTVIDTFYYEADIAANDWTKMLAYQPENIHRRKKQAYSEPNYNGDLLSVIGLADGSRSYWWFTDSLESTASLKGELRSKINKKGKIINVKQYLLLNNKQHKELNFSINLLVGPVKNNISNTRDNRVVRRISKSESKFGGIYYWWLTAFIHQALPFVEFKDFFEAEGSLDGIHKADESIYKGLKFNRRKIIDAKRKGVDLLPYFSAHLLNRVDPVYQRYANEWHALPRREMRIADKPYKTKRADVMLTHSAEGYSDYLLYRIAQAIDGLDIQGIYFDQGGVLNSNNPLHGGWIDSQGNSRSATEIIALRNFFKRLATLFYLKGKSGTVISHNSNTMILPAYSFVTGMLQGEEFIHSLEDHDYIKTISIDEVRTRLGSSAYGVPTIWLSELWVANKRLEKSKRKASLTQKEWFKTEAYRQAFEGLMALALLHDIPVQSYAPFDLRAPLFTALDWVDPADSEFIGYWLTKQSADADVLWSLYRNKKNNRMAVIISNLSSSSINFDVDALMKNDEFSAHVCYYEKQKNKMFFDSKIKINKKSFFILQLSCQWGGT